MFQLSEGFQRQEQSLAVAGEVRKSVMAIEKYRLFVIGIHDHGVDGDFVAHRQCSFDGVGKEHLFELPETCMPRGNSTYGCRTVAIVCLV